MKQKELKIEYICIDELKELPNNAKDHSIGDLHESINKFTFRKPLTVNKNGYIVEAGNGRLIALRQKKELNEEPPKGIKIENGKWLVPCILFDDDEKTQRKYSLADNRINELGGYHEDILYDNLFEIKDDLTGTGYDLDYLDELNYDLGYSEKTNSKDLSNDLEHEFEIVIECISEKEQEKIYNELMKQGYKCRLLTL